MTESAELENLVYEVLEQTDEKEGGGLGGVLESGPCPDEINSIIYMADMAGAELFGQRATDPREVRHHVRRTMDGGPMPPVQAVDNYNFGDGSWMRHRTDKIGKDLGHVEFFGRHNREQQLSPDPNKDVGPVSPEQSALIDATLEALRYAEPLTYEEGDNAIALNEAPTETDVRTISACTAPFSKGPGYPPMDVLVKPGEHYEREAPEDLQKYVPEGAAEDLDLNRDEIQTKVGLNENINAEFYNLVYALLDDRKREVDFEGRTGEVFNPEQGLYDPIRFGDEYKPTK